MGKFQEEGAWEQGINFQKKGSYMKYPYEQAITRKRYCKESQKGSYWRARKPEKS